MLKYELRIAYWVVAIRSFADRDTERFSYELRFDRLRTEDLAVRRADDTFSRAAVREESLLSNWDAPNWIIEGSRVRQIRSCARERASRRQRMLDECGAIDAFVTIQFPPVPTLAFGDWRWTDYELQASCRCGSVRHLTVLDLPRYGCGCLLLINESSWQIWGAGGNVPTIAPRYRPNALQPSGYLPALRLSARFAIRPRRESFAGRPRRG